MTATNMCSDFDGFMLGAQHATNDGGRGELCN